jgi:uncharacterized protein
VDAASDLAGLLRALRPERAPSAYVFAQAGRHGGQSLTPFATVLEDEGLTLVLPREQADAAGLRYDFVAARITLRVASSLEAVGLTAVVAARLADAGIACNVIAGLHHDHLFVPGARADEALTLLERLSAEARA